MNKLERIVKWRPAFDKRHKNPSKNYGIHGMELKFLLKGEHGATQFVVYTNWHLPHVSKEMGDMRAFHKPLPADLGYHAAMPQYEGQSASAMECCYTGTGKCYYDGSRLQAQELFDQFVEHGDKVVWERLESLYSEVCKP